MFDENKLIWQALLPGHTLIGRDLSHDNMNWDDEVYELVSNNSVRVSKAPNGRDIWIEGYDGPIDVSAFKCPGVKEGVFYVLETAHSSRNDVREIIKLLGERTSVRLSSFVDGYLNGSDAYEHVTFKCPFGSDYVTVAMSNNRETEYANYKPKQLRRVCVTQETLRHMFDIPAKQAFVAPVAPVAPPTVEAPLYIPTGNIIVQCDTPEQRKHVFNQILKVRDNYTAGSNSKRYVDNHIEMNRFPCVTVVLSDKQVIVASQRMYDDEHCKERFTYDYLLKKGAEAQKVFINPEESNNLPQNPVKNNGKAINLQAETLSVSRGKEFTGIAADCRRSRAAISVGCLSNQAVGYE